jgi:hypothetical protein
MPELSPKLRQLVDASRRVQGPSVEDRERVSRALGRRLAVGAVVAATALGSREVAGASVAKASLTAAAGASTVKWVVVSLAVVAGGLGSVGAYHHKTRSDPAPTVASAGPAHRSPGVATKASAAAPAPPPQADPDPPTTASAPARAAVSSVARPSDSLGRELELLRGAQRALDSGSPTQALTLLNQYAAEFPHGALRHESQAARIIALCAAGQRSAGLKAAEQFLQAEPSSPFARRVRTACGAPDSATGSSGQE